MIPATKETFVYMLGSRKHRILKVGVSHRPLARLRHLQTASPYKLTLFGAIPFESTDEALEMEAQIHQWLRYQKLEGEWFKLTGTAERMAERIAQCPTMNSLRQVFEVKCEPNQNSSTAAFRAI